MQQPASSSVSVVLASDVGPRAVSDSLTRQNNATPYIAGDVLCAMAGDPLAAVPLEFEVARSNGGSGTIIRVIATSPTVDAGLDTLLLYLFSSEPDVADDNAPFATALTDLVGLVPLALQPAIAGGTIWMSTVGLQWVFTTGAATKKLWGVPVAGDGWTPTAQQVFKLVLHTDRQ